MEWWIDLVIVGVLVLFSGLFSGLETAFVSLNRIRLHAKLDEGNSAAKVLERLYRNSEDFIGTVLIGTNLCDVGTVIFFTDFMTKIVPDPLLVSLYSALILTPVITLFSTLIPKVVFREFADEMMFALAYVSFGFYILFFPLQFLFLRAVKGFLSLIGIKKKKGGISKDEFSILLDMSAEKGALKESEKEFIESIMNFKNVKAREVMIPLIRLTCIEENETVELASALMISTKHTRLPVFRMRVDNMLGYIETKAIVESKKTDQVGKFIKPAVFVPDTAPINNVLMEMQAKQVQIAFVVDEYGGVSGVISNQDIVTEIVGEFVQIHEDWFVREEDSYLVSGMLDIDDLNDKLGLKIEKNDFETVGGFVLSRLERIPTEGDSFDVGRFTVEVVSVSNVRVKQVRISQRKKKEKKRGKEKHASISQ